MDAKPELILHFDVNKTIIMVDPVQDKDLDCILNEVVCEFTYGRVDAEGWWQWAGEPPTAALPTDGALVGYARFVEDSVPDVPGQKKERKQQRNRLKSTFTHPSQPGHHPVLEDHVATLHQRMTVPDTMRSHAHVCEIGGRSGKDVPVHYFILPSFFKLLVSLFRRKTKFYLIFRTFGPDIREVAREFNAFCEGRHPLCPEDVRLDGSAGFPDYRLNFPESFAAFWRGDNGMSLERDTTEPKELSGDSINKVDFRMFDATLKEMMNSHRSIAIRDFWPFWRENGESSWAGKVLPVDTTDRRRHSLFIDDNIRRRDKDLHIVGVTDVATGKSLTFDESFGVFVTKPIATESLIDEDYFVKLVDECHLRWVNKMCVSA
eukprot:780135_1